MNSNNIPSGDIVTDLCESDKIFLQGKLLLKSDVGRKGSYVLKSCTRNWSYTKFAVALSNSIVKIFDLHGKVIEEYELEKPVTDIKFAKDPAILFTSTLEGKIIVWDIRSQGPVQTLLDDSDGALKPILCFDCNSSDQILCAGTEVIREDSFLLFWDRRTSKNLGGYWNSHAGDITQVSFHPSKKSRMASSSVDGLINVFNLNEKTEDDALMYTLNVESPVSTITWMPSKSNNYLSCTTSIEDFQTWTLDDVQPKLSMSRETFYDTCGVKVDYLIDTVKIDSQYCLATGTNEGSVHLWFLDKGRISPHYLLKGHTDVVRTICCNEESDVILTGGDDGSVCYWKVAKHVVS